MPFPRDNNNLHRVKIAAFFALTSLGFVRCEEYDTNDSDHYDNESEIVSKVELMFLPENGGPPVLASFSDPDGDGGMSGTAEEIVLVQNQRYTLNIRVLNELAHPPVDISEELRHEAEEHLFFIFGEGVQGPASFSPTALLVHDYADRESDYVVNTVGEDLPVGLVHTITANQTGTSQLRLMLKHLPELNGTPQKQAGLPQQLADGLPLPGEVDIDISFVLRVL